MKKLRFVNPGELPGRIDRAGESYPAGPSSVLPLPMGQVLSRLPGGRLVNRRKSYRGRPL